MPVLPFKKKSRHETARHENQNVTYQSEKLRREVIARISALNECESVSVKRLKQRLKDIK